MSLGSVFVTGLFTGGASCAAVQGGLLAGVVARRREHNPTQLSPAATQEPVTASATAVVAVAERVNKASAADDAVPVASFLVGKLVSHVLFGALLGAFGAALQPNFRVRADMEIGAGVVMILMALSLFGILPQWLPSPPQRFSRLVRRSARAETAFAPAMLGFLTILVPCGVTLSVELLAVATGSPIAGAATMAAFVVGTYPLFAAIGYVVRRSSMILRGYLTKLAAVAVVAAGLLSINSGLVLNGSSITLAKVAPSISKALPPTLGGGQVVAPSPADTSQSVPSASLDANGAQQVVIQVGQGDPEGNNNPFSPLLIRAKAGIATQIVLQTGPSLGCAASFIVPQKGIEKRMETSTQIVIDIGTPGVGDIGFTCSTGMYSGTIQVVA